MVLSTKRSDEAATGSVNKTAATTPPGNAVGPPRYTGNTLLERDYSKVALSVMKHELMDMSKIIWSNEKMVNSSHVPHRFHSMKHPLQFCSCSASLPKYETPPTVLLFRLTESGPDISKNLSKIKIKKFNDGKSK
ncbi:hypothetical protein YC2023_039468 [Brassica napus]